MNQIDILRKLIQKGQDVLATHKPPPPNVLGFPTLDTEAFTAWATQCVNFLENNLPENSSYLQSFKDDVQSGYQSSVKSGIGILKSVLEDFELGSISGDQATDKDPLTLLINIFSNFHKVVRQLRSRHKSRPTIDIKDEYDVQDLIHALLMLYFDDIRPEEWTPSYAGKSSRMDFLLKKERIVIELKKTRDGLGAKEVGSQLIEDIERYKVHPDCELLVCFVYDPEGLIANPRGIEDDLTKSGKVKVRVFIYPE